ncbi:MAG: hypothetical protein WCY27_01290 [archaeon]|nr:hypothetical protein [archaeon]MDD2477961.1 hypothetical protein [Candidatus ainarchaeum sp.]MDD3084955.1 hypothetical protein [Candidatus ainarchaeum sp.]MDD4221409.1 hypothetical protein [Candidatus ainarchaeum sp.]MDD4662951.1 hypothetical protein [Candidatus ainarchaeum sp.]
MVAEKGKDVKKIRLNKEQTISLYRSKEQELKKISDKLEEIDNLLLEIRKAEQTLTEIKNIKDKESLLVNIGAGVLVNCIIENKKDVKITLPGNIIVDKDTDLILADIRKRKDELTDIRKKFVESYQNNVRTIQQVSKAIEQMEAQKATESQKGLVN